MNYDNCCEVCGTDDARTVYITSSNSYCKCYRGGGYTRAKNNVDLFYCRKLDWNARKKRSLHNNTEERPKRNLDSKSEINNAVVQKQSIGTIAQELKVECAPYDDGKRAYWNYDYTLPWCCWSKLIIFRCHCFQ